MQYRESVVGIDRTGLYGEPVNIVAHRVDNDVNGNARWVVHWLNFSHQGEWYDDVVKRLQRKGNNITSVRKYTAKWYGGGIVFQADESALKRYLQAMWDDSYAV